MRKRKWFAGMCLFLMLVLSACGKHADMADETKNTAEVQVPEEYALAVIVTINPQVKLYLDADNVIIGVEYLNEDAK